MKSFCQGLSAVAMQAIKTDQFVEQNLVQCLMLLAVRDPSAFAKFVTHCASCDPFHSQIRLQYQQARLGRLRQVIARSKKLGCRLLTDFAG
jgi:hypothetical protein